MEDDEEPPIAIQIQTETSEESSDAVSVGASVIIGNLGAGKSTLVNYILSGKHGKRIAVILNEFGEEIGVERAMINEGEGGDLVEEWVELANGCVCYTVKHSPAQALEQLIQRKDRLDHVLLETTGLANPAPWLLFFGWMNTWNQKSSLTVLLLSWMQRIFVFSSVSTVTLLTHLHFRHNNNQQS